MLRSRSRSSTLADHETIRVRLLPDWMGWFRGYTRNAEQGRQNSQREAAAVLVATGMSRITFKNFVDSALQWHIKGVKGPGGNRTLSAQRSLFNNTYSIQARITWYCNSSLSMSWLLAMLALAKRTVYFL